MHFRILSWLALGSLMAAALGCQSLVGGPAGLAESAPAADSFQDGPSDLRARTENFVGRPSFGTVAAFAQDSNSSGDDEESLETSTREPRLRIYRANIVIEVPHPESAIETLIARVEELGGYFTERVDNQITVRIPAESFSSLVDDIRRSGRVISQQLITEDVTKHYQDTALRLENAQKSRERLLALLERAEIADILKIEEQLQRLTYEIEQLEATLKYLESQVAYSTVTVGFRGASMGQPQTRQSRFWWINQVGARALLDYF